MYTNCLRCGRKIQNEKAREIGYGRVCKKKQEVEEAEFLRKQITIEDLERVHYLKTLPEYFDAVLNGNKNFEIRKNDREFKVGDGVVLLEYDGIIYTGKEIKAVITYLTTYEQKENYVVFSLEQEP